MELNDYQKGMVDTIVGVIEMMFEEMDEDMKKLVLERLQLVHF